MERRLKERLIGAAVLVLLAVIFIPMILSDSNRTETTITKTNIPKRPQGDFNSHIAPLQESDLKSAGEEGTAAPEQPEEQKPAPAPSSETKVSPTPEAKAKPETKVSPAPKAKPEPETKVSPAPEVKPEPETKVSPAPEAKPGTQPAPASAETAPAKAAPPATAASGPRRELTSWVVQIGSFNSHDNADRLLKKLQSSGYAAFIEPAKQGTETVYRVRVGPEVRRSSAESLKDKLARELKMKGILVLEYP